MNVRFLLRLVRLAVFAWWVFIFPYAGVHAQHMNPEKGVWITSADQSYLLRKIEPLQFRDQVASGDVIDLNPSATFQTMDGFGFALTGGSAGLLNQKLGATERKKILEELFRMDSTGIGISYLRISIGASDLDDKVFSYNDLPDGETDPALIKFSIAEDRKNLIPILKQILTVNSKIKIMASPWSAPLWMKSNRLAKGGRLRTDYYEAYAKYLLKYIEEMNKEGIVIDALTIQNEPENPNNTPSMVMSASEQNTFIKNYLGPLFKQAGIKTKIVLFDHNCDHPEYPISILNDPITKQFVDGTAFHLYLGSISALSTVKKAHPDKNIYFTEQWTSGDGKFGEDLIWHIKNVVIGATNNGAKAVLEWNLAADQNFNPHTGDGGCDRCLGALTIGKDVTRNVSYFIIAHASKFVPPGSIRIASNQPENLSNVGFITPSGKKVVIVLNDSPSGKNFSFRFKTRIANTYLPAYAVGTFVLE
jgi:glucosylceramidase